MERKTLIDRLLEGGAKGRSFITPSPIGEKRVYTVLDLKTKCDKGEVPEGSLAVEYSDKKRECINLPSHFNDEETQKEPIPGKFYETGTKDKKVFLCTKEGKLIDYLNREPDKEDIETLVPIENPLDYVTSLKSSSGKLINYISFIERYLSSPDETFLGLNSEEVLLRPGPDEYDLSKDPTLNRSKEATLEEIEKDVSLDTFGSGSGLLSLSLQADDTSLGGILDEIYLPGPKKPSESDLSDTHKISDEDFKPEQDVSLDTFGSGSGLLDLSIQADDTSLGGILDELYSPEPEKSEEPEKPQNISVPNNSASNKQKNPKKGFWKWLFSLD